MTDEKCSGDVVSLTVGHEERVEFANQFVLDLIEVAVLVELRNDHAVEYMYGITLQLIMMTQTQIDDVANDGTQGNLVIL